MGVDFLAAADIDLYFVRYECHQSGRTLCSLAVPEAESAGYPVSCVDKAVLPQGEQTELGKDTFTDGQCGEEVEFAVTPLVSWVEVRKLQNQNSQLRTLRRVLRGGCGWPKSLSQFKRYRTKLSIKDDILMCGQSGTVLLWSPWH